jgi:hypothetical protein
MDARTLNEQRNQIDHNAYPKSLKTKTVAELRYTIKDCREALEAYPDNPKAGYYQDEISYCGMELRRRQSKGGE